MIKITITDIIPEEGKEAEETEILNFDVQFPEGFTPVAGLVVPKCGRVNFKRHILPYLLPAGTKISKDATAEIAVATDGNGNVCLYCRRLTNSSNYNARE